MTKYWYGWVLLALVYPCISQAHDCEEKGYFQRADSYFPAFVEGDDSGRLNIVEERQVVEYLTRKYFKNRNNLEELTDYQDEIAEDCEDYIRYHSGFSPQTVSFFWRIPTRAFRQKMVSLGSKKFRLGHIRRCRMIILHR